jgi:hypothetical protein
MNIAFEPMLASPLATVEQQGDMTPWKGWFRSGISSVALPSRFGPPRKSPNVRTDVESGSPHP